MDLSFPLATITPTLDAGVLQVLAATTAGCTAAEVHRRVGHGSDEGVRKVLARLVGQGVVLVEAPARYPIYMLNRDHVAARHIQDLARVRIEIVDNIRAEVTGWEMPPSHAALFGSFARGTADNDSDIDVLIIRPDPWPEAHEHVWIDQLDRLAISIQSWTGNAAQIVDLSLPALVQMARVADPLLNSWRGDGVHLHGEPLLELLQRLR